MLAKLQTKLSQPATSGNSALKCLHEFSFNCRQITTKYIDVVGVLSIGIHFEFWIGQLTLSDEAMTTATIGWVIVALALVFVLAVSQIYNQGFIQTNQVVSQTGEIETETQLAKLNVFWFLKTTLFNRLAGVAFLSLAIIPIFLLIKKL